MNTIHINIVSAQKAIFSGEAVMVTAPGEQGDLGILPNHSPLLTRLLPGEVVVESPEGEKNSIFVSGGFLEIQPDLITVLADMSIRTAEIDEQRVREAESEARKAMEQSGGTKDYQKAYAELLALVAQLRVLEKNRNK